MRNATKLARAYDALDTLREAIQMIDDATRDEGAGNALTRQHILTPLQRITGDVPSGRYHTGTPNLQDWIVLLENLVMDDEDAAEQERAAREASA